MAAGDIIVQHGSITFGASEDTDTATITAVGSTGSAFVICLGVIDTGTGVGGITNNPDDLTVKLQLTNTTTVTATRLSTGNDSDVTVYFAVVEYVGAASGPNEFKVIRDSRSIANGSSTHGSPNFTNWTATTTTAEAVNIPSGFTHASTTHEGNSMRFTYYNDATGYDGASTSRAFSGSRSGTSTVGEIVYESQIVEFTGSNWRVYFINADGGGSDVGSESSPAEHEIVDYNFNAVDSSVFDWDRAFIIGSKALARVPDGSGGYLDPHDDANDQGWVVYPGNDTTGNVTAYVAVSNGTYSTSYHYFSGQVVYNVDSTFMTVEHLRSIDSGTISSLSAATTNDYTITDVSDTGYAFPLVSAYTDDTTTDLARAAYQAHLTSTTNLRLTRAVATGTGELAAQIIKFEAPSIITLPLHSSSTTHHSMALATMPELGLHSSSTTIHGLSLGNEPWHRDTVYGAETTISTDLSQYGTNLTASSSGGYELTSTRANITGERNIYYRSDLSTADSEDVLMRHGDTTTNTTNTWGLVVVTGGTSVGGFYGSTKVIEADLPSASGTAQDYSIGWSTRANPDTTGASDAQCSMLWVYNHDTGERSIVHSTHAAPTGNAAYAFSVHGWWNGASMQGQTASAPTKARLGTTFYSSVQYEEDWVGASPYSSSYARQVQRFPITKGSGLGSDGQWYGPQAQYVAHQIGVSGLRLASPLVNEVYRDAETISYDGSGLYEPEHRWIYAPGDQTKYQLISTHLRWIRVPVSYSRVRVRVNVSSWPNSGADVPIGLACYSMERPPPWPTAWKRTVPVVATYSHTSASDREWVDLGELELVRLLVPNDQALDQTTHLCLALAIDPAGASTNDTNARVQINGWQVVPVGSPNADYDGPETPPNQQLQPMPIGGLPPSQMLQG